MDHSTSTKVAVLLIYDPCNFTFGSFSLNVHVFSLLFSNTSDPTSILPAHLVRKLELLMTFLLFFTLFKKPASALLFSGPHV